ncbi:MAG TPA: ROK family protein, partial [Longimicrobiales bacterium]|nr:ROK family protein [Longimicrobiales bacterium]
MSKMKPAVSLRDAAYVPEGGATVVADFGGTNARFATVGESPRDLHGIEVFRCAEFPSLQGALEAYLQAKGIGRLAEVCIAVAGPVDKDLVDLPNNHWIFSKSQLETTLGAPLTVVNDFTAQALAIDLLEADELHWVGAPRPDAGGIRTIIGPGTGLGVAVQTAGGEIIPSEAGHMGFAAASEHEIDLLRALFFRYRRVSIERLASGPGLENIYWANRRLTLPDPEADQERRTPAEIAAMAHEGDALAQRSIEDFFDILAAFAGDMALATWATGGIYLSGGVVRKLVRFFDEERFRARF